MNKRQRCHSQTQRKQKQYEEYLIRIRRIRRRTRLLKWWEDARCHCGCGCRTDANRRDTQQRSRRFCKSKTSTFFRMWTLASVTYTIELQSITSVFVVPCLTTQCLKTLEVFASVYEDSYHIATEFHSVVHCRYRCCYCYYYFPCVVVQCSK